MQYLKPSFFIIGERKCGTSSLYRYLLSHPLVLPCKQKEPQFFTRKPWHIWWNIRKYYALFPTVSYEGDLQIEWPELDKAGKLFTEPVQFERKEGVHYITGEASANTFFQAHPRVVHYFLPQVKFILMLRNPVDRTWSHFRMLRRFQDEGRRGAQLLEFGLEMQKAMEMVRIGKKHNLLSPGLYVQQLKKWWKVYPKKQFYIIQMEDLEKPKKAAKVMDRLCRFLELPPHDFSKIMHQKFNVAPGEEIPNEIRQELHQFFLPYNQGLEDLLDRKMKWD